MKGHDCKPCEHNVLKSGLSLGLRVFELFRNLAELH